MPIFVGSIKPDEVERFKKFCERKGYTILNESLDRIEFLDRLMRKQSIGIETDIKGEKEAD